MNTQCENCLHDFKDNEWVYCQECWEKFEEDIKKLRIKLFQLETKPDRPQVDERFIEKWNHDAWWGSGRTKESRDRTIRRMLKEAGIAVEDDTPTATVNDALRIEEEK